MSLSKSLAFRSLAFASSSLLAAACSSPGGSGAPSEANTAEEVAALDAPNGGLDLTSKEAPAFGDPEVEALPLMESAPLVPQAQPSNPGSASSAAPDGIPYRVALVWGHLPPPHDKDATDVLAQPAQWTGSVSVSAGSLSLLRTIAFGSSDSLSATSAQTIAFSSTTDAYVDGILVRIVVPWVAPTLHFATGLVTMDVDLSRLTDSPGGIGRAADGVSGLGWFGFQEDQCVRGFLLGRWVKDQPGLGRSLAAVSDANGALLGYVRGGWGYAPGRSDEVWFDKYIDTEGNPKGLTFGWYGDGAFNGLSAATDEHDVGAVSVGPTEGFYSDADDTGDGRGVWLGRWSAPCVP